MGGNRSFRRVRKYVRTSLPPDFDAKSYILRSMYIQHGMYTLRLSYMHNVLLIIVNTRHSYLPSIIIMLSLRLRGGIEGGGLISRYKY